MTIFSYIRILVLVTTSLVLSGCGGGGSSSSGASSSDPISMTTVAIHGLNVSFNASGYVEYQANQARYDSIIQKTMSSCHFFIQVGLMFMLTQCFIQEVVT